MRFVFAWIVSLILFVGFSESAFAAACAKCAGNAQVAGMLHAGSAIRPCTHRNNAVASTRPIAVQGQGGKIRRIHVVYVGGGNKGTACCRPQMGRPCAKRARCFGGRRRAC